MTVKAVSLASHIEVQCAIPSSSQRMAREKLESMSKDNGGKICLEDRIHKHDYKFDLASIFLYPS